MAMGQDHPAHKKATALAEKILAALIGLWIAALPLWAGKIDAWRQWIAAAGTLSLGAGWAAIGGLRMPRCGRVLLVAVVLLAAAMWGSVAPCDSVRNVLLAVACLVTLAAAFDAARGGHGPLVVGAMAAGAGVSGLWALREYLFTAIVLGDATWRPFGPFVNPNALAGYLALSLPALFVMAAGLRRWAAGNMPGHPSRVGWPVLAVVCAMSAAGLVATASKGALAALTAALLAVGLAVPRARKLAGLALAAVALTLLAPPTRSRIAAAFSSQRKTTYAFRLQTWRGTWRMAAARPWLGWGPGSFRHAYPMFAAVPFTSMAHCSWLQIAAEGGFPAAATVLAGLLWCAGSLALASRAKVKPSAEDERDDLPGGAREGRGKRAASAKGRASQANGLAAGGLPLPLIGPAAAVGLTALIVHNFVDYTWYLPAVALTAMAMVGSVLGLLGAGQRGATPADGGRRNASSGRKRSQQDVERDGDQGGAENGWAVTRMALGRPSVVAALAVAAAICFWHGWDAVQAAKAAAEARQGFFMIADTMAAGAARRSVFCADLWLTLAKIREGAAGNPPDRSKLIEAAEAYMTAATWAPTEPGAYIGAARCLRLAGRTTGALRWAAAAAAVYPRGPVALLEYARCLEASGRSA